jgi:protein-S-isoprenylcysteine O-methyltransferase
LIVSIFWVAIIAYWLFSAFNAKKNLKTGDWARDAGIRVLIIIVIIVVFEIAPHSGFLGHQFGVAAQVVGTVLAVAGIAFAMWARLHLGSNWSGTPSIKEGHELVTSGPYRFVRHPIYTGIIVAALGSGFVVGAAWFVVFVVMGVNFLYRIPIEERYMMQLFPDQYPEYRKRTKALVPWVW